MDLEGITNRLIERGWKPKQVARFFKQYQAIPLTLPVEDVPMQRISEVLTNNGYITTETCDGHGKILPNAFFYCEDQNHMRHLAHILARECGGTNFRWEMTVWSSSPSSNLNSPLFYILRPEDSGKKPIKPKRDYDKLMQDLDIIGIYVMDYFNEVKETSAEKLAEKKAKKQRGRRQVGERVKELGNLFAGDENPFASPVKPEVVYVYGGEQEDYRREGEIVEEFRGGFEIKTSQDVKDWKHPFNNSRVRVGRGYKLNMLVTDEGLVYSYPVKTAES